MDKFKAKEIEELWREEITENREMLQDIYSFYCIAQKTLKNSVAIDKIDSIKSHINKVIEKMVELQLLVKKGEN